MSVENAIFKSNRLHYQQNIMQIEKGRKEIHVPSACMDKVNIRGKGCFVEHVLYSTVMTEIFKVYYSKSNIPVCAD